MSLILWILLLISNFTNPAATNIVESAQTAEEQTKKESNFKQNLTTTKGNSQFSALFSFRPEYFYSENLVLFNNEIPADRSSYAFYTFDFITSYGYGKASHDYNIITFLFNLRSQGIWGNNGIITRTSDNRIPGIDPFNSLHRHEPIFYMPWIRELWISFIINDLLHIPFTNKHAITFGAFPYQLGRGISLGTLQLRGLENIAINSRFYIRQYIFGMLLSGEIIKKKLLYDLYGAFLDNGTVFSNEENAFALNHVYGHRRDLFNTRGIHNYVITGKLRYTPISETKPLRKIYFEPYVLYANNPNLSIEFPQDSPRKLITLGAAAEFEFGNLGFGFDTAFNFGHQVFKGVDRNIIIAQNRNGVETQINTQVFQLNETSFDSALDIVQNQVIIDNSPQIATQNGKIIGSNKEGILVNALTRFRDPLVVKLRGSMFVFDIGYFLRNPSFRINGTIGFASGGELALTSRPSTLSEAFIGINDNYFGIRVKSLFYPIAISPFLTNVFFVGSGLDIAPQHIARKWVFNPNIIAYWFDTPLFAFDRKTETDSTKFARKYLGLEINLLAQAPIVTNLSFFFLGALFFPGNYYKDIKDRPLNPILVDILDEPNRTGIISPPPRFSNKPAFFIDFGLQYFF